MWLTSEKTSLSLSLSLSATLPFCLSFSQPIHVSLSQTQLLSDWAENFFLFPWNKLPNQSRFLDLSIFVKLHQIGLASLSLNLKRETGNFGSLLNMCNRQFLLLMHHHYSMTLSTFTNLRPTGKQNLYTVQTIPSYVACGIQNMNIEQKTHFSTS